MDTAHQTDLEKKEYFDEEDVLDIKAMQLAEWIKEAKHFTIFTGAGISTSTGIPDFRSGVDTVLKTGPGVWEAKAKKIAYKKKNKAKTVQMSSAIPSPTHMAINKLHELGYLKFLIS